MSPLQRLYFGVETVPTLIISDSGALIFCHVLETSKGHDVFIFVHSPDVCEGVCVRVIASVCVGTNVLSLEEQ